MPAGLPPSRELPPAAEPAIIRTSVYFYSTCPLFLLPTTESAEKTLVYHTVRRKLPPVPKTNVYHLTTKPPGITHNQAREDHALVLTPMFLKSDAKRGC